MSVSGAFLHLLGVERHVLDEPLRHLDRDVRARGRVAVEVGDVLEVRADGPEAAVGPGPAHHVGVQPNRSQRLPRERVEILNGHLTVGDFTPFALVVLHPHRNPASVELVHLVQRLELDQSRVHV